MNGMKRQKDRTLKDELPVSAGAQYATGDQLRNDSRKSGQTEPRQRQHPVVDVPGDGSKIQCYKKQYPFVDVTGDRSKVHCCKEQYCIGSWNVRSMNQAKFKVVKQE